MTYFRANLFDSNGVFVTNATVFAHDIVDAYPVAVDELGARPGDTVRLSPVSDDDIHDATIDAAYMSGF